MFKEYIAYCSAYEVEKTTSFFTDDYVYKDVAAETLNHGKDGVKAEASSAYSAFPNFKIKVKSFFSIGYRIASEWIMNGTHSSDYPGLPTTGVSSSVRGASIIELQKRRIKRNTNY